LRRVELIFQRKNPLFLKQTKHFDSRKMRASRRMSIKLQCIGVEVYSCS